MALALSMMIGVRARPRSAARMARVAVRPSMTGICMSIRMTSNRDRPTASTARAPFSTVTTSAPAEPRISWTTRWLVGWSSASRTRSDRSGR